MTTNFALEGSIQDRKLSIICTGVVQDYDEFKIFKNDMFDIAQTDEIEHLKEKAFDELEVKFINSYPLPTCLIGFFLKLSERDQIKVNLITNENKMLSFFISVFLDEKLNVKLFL
ncbi:hypothetical protein CQA53_02795 [Helicobacter didelphidarum]|uniref:Uncharacterized protein n=1 Tax=Helicobacter didelphidarum TaxID=2040648 RepID=A0A3D8IP70_9HELI|nr:hypothetical protein [Helicobacter didelphidarum]RDU66715.1 hypothetical protein CQA53_02795 [Helicobacter didelphidarum]